MQQLSGSQPFAVLLCKFSDYLSHEPHDESWFADLFANRGTGGVNDYWSDASLNRISLDGTDVFGWRDVGIELESFKTKYSYPKTDENGNPVLDAHGNPQMKSDRWGKTQFGVNAFTDVNFSKYKGVVVFYNMDVEDGGFTGNVGNGRVLANTASLPGGVTWFAHEIGHALGFIDSFDDSPREIDDIAGVYCDPHDIMSAMAVYNHPMADFHLAGPLLNAAAMDLAGWLDPDRLLVWQSPSYSMNPITLKSLSRASQNGYLSAKCGAFYLELRTRDGWDAGIPRATVLIHRTQQWVNDIGTWVIATAPGPQNHCWNHEFLAGDSISLVSSEQSGDALNRFEWTFKVESIDDVVGEAKVSVHVKCTTLPLFWRDFLLVEPISFIRIRPNWADIGLPNGEIVSLAADSEAYALTKELLKAIGTAYGSTPVRDKFFVEKPIIKLFSKAEKSLRKITRKQLIRR